MHGSVNGAMLLRIRRRERAATFETIGTKLRSIVTAARCHVIVPPSLAAGKESKRFARLGARRNLPGTKAYLRRFRRIPAGAGQFGRERAGSAGFSDQLPYIRAGIVLNYSQLAGQCQRQAQCACPGRSGRR